MPEFTRLIDGFLNLTLMSSITTVQRIQVTMSSPDHSYYVRLALEQAKLSPPKPSNYCVGAALVDEATGDVLATGYSLELPGNTHAEQCALQKFATSHKLPEERIGEVLPPQSVIYTTMEPCIERLSGNLPCVDRIIRTRGGNHTGISKIYSCIKEPDTFVKGNSGRAKLESAGIKCIYLKGFEDESLEVATAGHEKAAKE